MEATPTDQGLQQQFPVTAATEPTLVRGPGVNDSPSSPAAGLPEFGVTNSFSTPCQPGTPFSSQNNLSPTLGGGVSSSEEDLSSMNGRANRQHSDSDGPSEEQQPPTDALATPETSSAPGDATPAGFVPATGVPTAHDHNDDTHEQHVQKFFSHDPYCPQTAMKLMFMCTCADCTPTPPTYDIAVTEDLNSPYTTQMQQPTHSHSQLQGGSLQMMQQQLLQETQEMSSWAAMEQQYAASGFTPYPSRDPNSPSPKHKNGPIYGATEFQEEMLHPQAPVTDGICFGGTHVSKFMPPAPPPLSKSDVLYDRDGLTKKQAANTMKNMLKRWHTRIEASQGNHMSPDRFCPRIEEFNSVEEWAIACHVWWNKYFAPQQRSVKYPKRKYNPQDGSMPAAAGSPSYHHHSNGGAYNPSGKKSKVSSNASSALQTPISSPNHKGPGSPNKKVFAVPRSHQAHPNNYQNSSSNQQQQHQQQNFSAGPPPPHHHHEGSSSSPIAEGPNGAFPVMSKSAKKKAAAQAAAAAAAAAAATSSVNNNNNTIDGKPGPSPRKPARVSRELQQHLSQQQLPIPPMPQQRGERGVSHQHQQQQQPVLD